MPIDSSRGPRAGQLPANPATQPPTQPQPGTQARPSQHPEPSPGLPPTDDQPRGRAPADRRVEGPGAADALDGAEDAAASAAEAAAAAAEAVAAAQALSRPAPDDGKTWGGPTSARDLNFGHPHVDGHLFRRDPAGALVWADNGKAVTPAQWANMPAAQHAKIEALAPGTGKALKGGEAARARRPEPPAAPAVDADLRRRLEAGLHNAEAGAQHHCFAYAWAVVKAAGGLPLGLAREDALYRQGAHGLADLPKLVAEGRIKPGDVIYANTHPGADPQSLDLAYGPHWFVFMGQGQWADQYGVKSLAELQQTIPGRQLDTIFRTF